MAKYDKLSLSDIRGMTYEQKVDVARVYSKRLNTRMKSLKNDGKITRATKNADKFLSENKLDSYYQGVKYKSVRELNKTLTHLHHQLNDDSSRNVNKKPKKAKEQQAEKKQRKKSQVYEFDQISGASYEAKKQIAKDQARIANRRMKELEKAGYTEGAYNIAVHDLRGENRFPNGKDISDEKKLDVLLRNLSFFLNSRTSTVGGNKKVFAKAIKTLRDKGFNIRPEQEQALSKFLKSKLFQSMRGMHGLDSNQVLEDFLQAMENKVSPNEIMKDFEEYMKNPDEMTFEQVAERRKGKKLLK